MADAPSDRPDLILVMTDQQRHDQVGYASCGHFETPTLDGLAASGVVFETAYSASTVCVPARNALLTGILPHRLPVQENGMALREGVWTIAHALGRAGYETALIGKMHFAPVHSAHGFETMRLCEHLSAQGLGPLSQARGDLVDDYHGWLIDRGLPDRRLEETAGQPWSLPIEAHPTEWVVNESRSFLAQRDRRRPLFLVVSFPHPHAPYDPPEPYRSMYAPADSELPVGGYELNEGLPLWLQLATSASITRAEAADPRLVQTFLATVRGLVRQIDDALGRLVAELDLSRSVLLFTSDHGDFAGHRGLMRKNPWVPFDDLARVPLMATGAGVTGGRRVPALVQSSDIPLTLLELAGVPAPSEVPFDSRSLAPLLADRPGPEDLDRAVVCSTTMSWPMIRRGSYKYLEHVEHVDGVLFDLQADPDEQHNLVDDAGHRAVGEELRDALRVVRERPVISMAT